MLVSSLNDGSVGGSIPGREIESVTASRPTTRLSEPRLRTCAKITFTTIRVREAKRP